MITKQDLQPLHIAFIQEHASLLERCGRHATTLEENELRELILKARAHFNYSLKTRDVDIRRAVVNAYRKHTTQQPREALGAEY